MTTAFLTKRKSCVCVCVCVLVQCRLLLLLHLPPPPPLPGKKQLGMIRILIDGFEKSGPGREVVDREK
jgi:hypothetical protein